MRGFIDPHGSWNTACTFERYSFSSARPKRLTSLPSNSKLAAGQLLEQQHHLGDRRLARARFAHQAQRLAGLDGERHVVDRPHPAHGPLNGQALGDREVLLEVAPLEQRRRSLRHEPPTVPARRDVLVARR